MTILESFKFNFLVNAVPKPITSFLNWLYVISVQFSFGLNFSNKNVLSAYSFEEFINISFAVEKEVPS